MFPFSIFMLVKQKLCSDFATLDCVHVWVSLMNMHFVLITVCFLLVTRSGLCYILIVNKNSFQRTEMHYTGSCVKLSNYLDNTNTLSTPEVIDCRRVGIHRGNLNDTEMQVKGISAGLMSVLIERVTKRPLDEDVTYCQKSRNKPH